MKTFEPFWAHIKRKAAPSKLGAVFYFLPYKDKLALILEVKMKYSS